MDGYVYVYDDSVVDRDELSDLYRVAPLGEKSARHLATVFANCMYTCFRLAQALDATQRREIDRLTGDGDGPRLAHATEPWTGGVTLEELCRDDGTVDTQLVHDAVNSVLEEHPAWSGQVPDLGQGRRGCPATTRTSWADALRPQT
jgi:hypothetical protein